MIDWTSVACGCGRGGEHLPQQICDVLAEPVSDPSGGALVNEIVEGHAVIQSTVFESAIPVSKVLACAAVESEELDKRMQIYRALLNVVSCDSQSREFEEELPPIVTECRKIVEGIKERIYVDLVETKSPLPLNLLEYCEGDEMRLRHCFDLIRGDLPVLYGEGYRLFARREEGW